jgi:hypothetical protein
MSLRLLVHVDSRPAGAVIARARRTRLDRVAWRTVLVPRTGPGPALLRPAFGLLRSRGCESVRIDVDTNNGTRALAVYRRAGMKTVGKADQWSKTY